MNKHVPSWYIDNSVFARVQFNRNFSCGWVQFNQNSSCGGDQFEGDSSCGTAQFDQSSRLFGSVPGVLEVNLINVQDFDQSSNCARVQFDKVKQPTIYSYVPTTHYHIRNVIMHEPRREKP